MEYNRRSLRQRQTRRKTATQSHGPTVPLRDMVAGPPKAPGQVGVCSPHPLRIEGFIAPLRPVPWTERSPWHCSHRHAERRAPGRGLQASPCSTAHRSPRGCPPHHLALPLAKSAGVTYPPPLTLTLTPVTPTRAPRVHFFHAKWRLTSSSLARACEPCDAAGSSRGPATRAVDPPVAGHVCVPSDIPAARPGPVLLSASSAGTAPVAPPARAAHVTPARITHTPPTPPVLTASTVRV